MVWTIQWGYDSYELGMRCFGRVIFMCSTYFPHSYCYMNIVDDDDDDDDDHYGIISAISMDVCECDGLGDDGEVVMHNGAV